MQLRFGCAGGTPHVSSEEEESSGFSEEEEESSGEEEGCGSELESEGEI